MLITVKIIKGKECTIEVSASSSISAVKRLVAEELQIPVDQQRLVFKGKTLSDASCLCDYDIVDGNRLHLFVRKADEIFQHNTNILWDHLRKFLEKHFAPADAKKVYEEFHKCNLQLEYICPIDEEEHIYLYVEFFGTTMQPLEGSSLQFIHITELSTTERLLKGTIQVTLGWR